MSAEVVKKRGRPKKVVLDSVEPEISGKPKKATARSEFTTAAPKPAISKTTPSKPSQAVKTSAKSTSTTSLSPKDSSKPQVQSNTKAAKSQPTPPTDPTPKTPVTVETSRILKEVRDLSAKNKPSPVKSTNPSKPNPPNFKPQPTPKPTAPLPQKTTAFPIAPPTIKSNPPALAPQEAPVAVKKTSQPPPRATAMPNYPTAALNSQNVDNITIRAGARPNTAGSKNKLPPGYKSVARKVSLAIVAMPIAIVTSWVLYQRLILGEDRKLLVKPGLTMVEGTGEPANGAGPSTL